MADMAPVYDALRQADAAGDKAGAQKLATYIRSQGTTPATAPVTTTAAAQEPGIGTQVMDVGKDVGGMITRGVGTAVQGIQNVGHALSNEPTVPYDAPEAAGQRYSAWAQHPGDTEPAVSRAMDFARGMPFVGPTMEAVSAAGGLAHRAGTLIENSGPAGQTFVQDYARPAGEILGAAGAAEGVSGLGKAALGGTKAVLGGLDTAVNRLTSVTGDQAARVASNPQLVKMRADGWKVTANDVAAKTNPADDMHPNADLPGPSSTTPDVKSGITVSNRTKATADAAADVGLKNTRAVDQQEIESRKAQEGVTYGNVGNAVGVGRVQPTTALDHDISVSGTKSADPVVQQKIDNDVAFYRGAMKGPLDGPKAVQTVRTLRNSAQDLNMSQVPGDKLRGASYQNIANSIEDELMRQLPANAQDLKAQFPQSRMQLAKLHELSEVTQGGQVSPAKVLQLQKDGKPLSGAMASIANAADVAPESMGVAKSPEGSIIDSPLDTRAGMWHAGVKGIRAIGQNIPGRNPTTEAFQVKHYGEVGGPAVTPPSTTPMPVQRPPNMVLTPPEGQAFRPPVQGELNMPAGRAAPPPFELQHPEGQAFEPAQRLLVRRDTAGNPLEPATWDREALQHAMNFKGETPTDEMTGAALGNGIKPGSQVKVPREPSPTQKLRKRLGEAMQ